MAFDINAALQFRISHKPFGDLGTMQGRLLPEVLQTLQNVKNTEKTVRFWVARKNGEKRERVTLRFSPLRRVISAQPEMSGSHRYMIDI